MPPAPAERCCPITDSLTALVLLPFPLFFSTMTVIAARSCLRHRNFSAREKIPHLILILLVPFFGAIWWFETAEARGRITSRARKSV